MLHGLDDSKAMITYRTKVTDQEAQAAISTLIQWIGDDANREDLAKTPNRVAEVLKELFSGYQDNPAEILNCTLRHTEDLKEMVLFKGIKFVSFCEHHVLPMIGTIDIAYIPTHGVVGFDRISRLVNAFSKRLQLQERMTTQIAEALFKHIKSDGVAVLVRASHQCMSMVGAKKDTIEVYTEKMLGSFQYDNHLRTKFLTLTSNNSNIEKNHEI